MKTPLTAQRFRNHLTYSWWKYLLLCVVAIFGWNLLFAVTRYQAPEEKQVIMNIYVYADQEALDAYMAQVNAEQMPDMEEMHTYYSTPGDQYSEMVFSTHIAVGEGDVFLLNRDFFQRYASAGSFLPLENEPMIALLEEAGISLSQGWRAVADTGERHLYGIPCVNLPGIAAYVLDPTDCYLVVSITNGNDENVLQFLNIFIADMLKEPEPTAPSDE